MYDVIIIGGGPSGMTAALNLLRSGRSVLIIEKEAFGGQMATSPKIENIPGIKSISGLDFTDQLFNQISDLGVEFEMGEVSSLKKENNIFTVTTDYGTYESRSIIFANGCSHRPIGLPKEDKFVGQGISYCAVCDGAFYKGQEVYLIGDANTAAQYALMLSTYCSKVHMFALFNKLFADKILQERIKQTPNIEINYEMNLVELIGNDKLEGLRFHSNKDNKDYVYGTNNVFIAIGQIPHNKNFAKFVNLNDAGFIITDETMSTNIKGAFAIGDTRVKSVRQVSTAIGDASTASVFVDMYLRELD